jgi:hypothetical protein
MYTTFSEMRISMFSGPLISAPMMSVAERSSTRWISRVILAQTGFLSFTPGKKSSAMIYSVDQS